MYAQNTPIQFLPGVGPRTASVLHELGIHTAGQLARIPTAMLVALFGPSIHSVVRHAAIAQHRVPQKMPHQKKTGHSMKEKVLLAMHFVTML